ncbi:hypothetical protein CLCR_06731 [Cladophialophora carrionii]|uniref:Nephrocystin 3-like N-terminal domain-containing protein n=1 Tax=Cladophialophora carrionii TaxID=86049 RepID=A0A1C1CMM9_9EURO|nr:hypothetical protein CLCR_06731 [Cladophialophora carrionii]
MASGLEGLGAFAAASQIAEQLVRIVKSGQTIRDAPKEAVQHIASLQQLTRVVESIKANPSYQSRQVAEILSLVNTKTNALSDILVRLQADPGDSKAKAIQKALNSTWNADNVANKLDQIDGDKMTLALCLARIDAQVQSEQIRNLSSQLQGLRNSNNTSALTTEQWKDYCLSELLITNPADDRAMLTRTKGERSYGTCAWITEHPIYRSWKDPACQSPLLWISGGPGKGKTILSVFLTEELEQRAAQSNNNMQQVLYFFCDNKDNRRNKASCIIRGLILQVLLSHSDVISHLLPDFKIQKTNLFEENSFDSLWRIFKNIIREIDVASVSCVLDGIDELQDTSLVTLLAKLRDLDLPKLKVIALSRHFPRSIKDALGHYPTIRLDPDSEKEVSKDVDTYVRSNVKELSRVKRYPLDLERHVFETLKLRSGGTSRPSTLASTNHPFHSPLHILHHSKSFGQAHFSIPTMADSDELTTMLVNKLYVECEEDLKQIAKYVEQESILIILDNLIMKLETTKSSEPEPTYTTAPTPIAETAVKELTLAPNHPGPNPLAKTPAPRTPPKEAPSDTISEDDFKFLAANAERIRRIVRWVVKKELLEPEAKPGEEEKTALAPSKRRQSDEFETLQKKHRGMTGDAQTTTYTVVPTDLSDIRVMASNK